MVENKWSKDVSHKDYQLLTKSSIDIDFIIVLRYSKPHKNHKRFFFLSMNDLKTDYSCDLKLIHWFIFILY